MSKQSAQWQEVPLEHLSAWDKIFAANKEGMNLSEPCPICGNRKLHRYYNIGKPADSIIQGNRFVADGELWEWCSFCRSYLHLSALVPEWWSDPHLKDKIQLTHQPEALNQAIQQATP